MTANGNRCIMLHVELAPPINNLISGWCLPNQSCNLNQISTHSQCIQTPNQSCNTHSQCIQTLVPPQSKDRLGVSVKCNDNKSFGLMNLDLYLDTFMPGFYNSELLAYT